jgi:predicted ester cyclase
LGLLYFCPKREGIMKKYLSVISLVFLLCFVIGCQDKAAMAELEEFKAQAALEEQNKELVNRLMEELNRGNIEMWRQVCAPEFAYYSPSNVPEPMSVDYTIECFQMAFKGFPDINWETPELIAKGDEVIARFIQRGTHEGEFRGIPVSGNKIEFGVISIFHIKEGKIVEIREESDGLGFMMQLGMELKPKEAGK